MAEKFFGSGKTIQDNRGEKGNAPLCALKFKWL